MATITGTESGLLSSSGLRFLVSDWQLLDQLAVLFALWPFSLLPQGSADQLKPHTLKTKTNF